MKIDRVTITGADDSTDIEWLLRTTERFPFVEWGILMSESMRGGARFPSHAWMVELDKAVADKPIKLSAHVCGQWVRSICKGQWTPFVAHHATVLRRFNRVQLNFHSYAHTLTERFVPEALKWSKERSWQLIFQVDGVNDHLVSNAYDEGGDEVVTAEMWTGATVTVEVDRISRVANGEIWIDMERRVRTPDDGELDTAAVESVLEQMAGSPYLAK